ncbi:hypothetical protein BJV74DRAFT_871469 [Russula compacta]|nr:hypothetical protein BJV74DRAFT_871469 [Russula compacta]
MTMHTHSSNNTAEEDELPASGRVSWTTDNEAYLIQVLLDSKRDSVGVSNQMFKDGVFMEITSQLCKKNPGMRFTKEKCKAKWQGLKATYATITELKGKLGFVWDDEEGVNVTPER